jgi:ribosome-binding protein aMBF1 (putative translation factor)
MSIIRPVAETKDTVTLSRADYEALLDAAEDAADLAAVDAHRAYEQGVGWETARGSYYSVEEAQRLWGGESRVKLWREKRGLSQRALAAKAEVSASYLAEIEAGRKPGSVEAVVKIARALGVGVEALVG